MNQREGIAARLPRNLVAAACVALALSGLAAAPAEAALFLMSTDGVSGGNNSRAATLGHTVSTNSIAGIAATSAAALSAFDVVWINPALSDYNSLRTAVASGGSLEQYVSGGGVLVLNVAGNSGNQLNIAPGGVDYDRSTLHQSETFTTPTSPYLTGAGYGGATLSTSDFLNWGLTDHGTLQNLLPGSTTILSNSDGASFVQYSYGSGVVLLDTLTYGWGSAGANGPARDNLIQFAAFVDGQPAQVPEPGTLALAGLALAGLGWNRRRGTTA